MLVDVRFRLDGADGKVGDVGSGPRSADEFYATFCVTGHEADGPGDGPAAPFCRVAPGDVTRAEFINLADNPALDSDTRSLSEVRRVGPRSHD